MIVRALVLSLVALASQASVATAATLVGTGTTLGGDAFAFSWTLPEDSPRTSLAVNSGDVAAEYGPTPGWRLEASIAGLFDAVLTPDTTPTTAARISVLDRVSGEDGFTAEWVGGPPLFPVTSPIFGEGNVISLQFGSASHAGTLSGFDLPHAFDRLSLDRFRFAYFQYQAAFENGAVVVTDYGTLDTFSVIPEPGTAVLLGIGLAGYAAIGRWR